MRPIFVQIKCEMGAAYKVAQMAVDTIPELSEIYSTSGQYTCWASSIWTRTRTPGCS